MTINTKQKTAPSLNDLMIRFLANRSDATLAGAVESSEGEVELYEVSSGFRVDHRNAWKDAIAAVGTPSASAPNELAEFIRQAGPCFALPMAAGNFPQRITDNHALLSANSPIELQPGQQLPLAGLSGLRTWIVRETKKKSISSSILAAGMARAIGEFDWATELLKEVETDLTPELRIVWENEWAALQWHSMHCAEALKMWMDMEKTPATTFNIGMALLFLGRYSEAISCLQRAQELIPATSGWYALAGLYLSVAEIHA